MKREIKKLAALSHKAFAIIAIVGIVFAFANFFILQASMVHDSMADCPYMAQTNSMCPMDADSHIALWQTLFSGESQKFSLDFILFVLASLGVILALRALNWRLDERLKLTLLRLYDRGSPQSQLFIRIKQLFARGLLNPKIFDYSTV